MKQKSVWFCTSCGNESPKWMGRCPACGEWNTMVEEKVATGKQTPSRQLNISVPGAGSKPVPLSEIDSTAESRISLNNAEVDRILGGGLVEGSLVLIGGEPGIGKSTLSLQIPLHCKGLKTLYVTGEESAKQVKLRAAGLWVTAAIGLACGTGMYLVAVITTVLVLFGLEVLNAIIPQIGTTTVALKFTARSKESIKRVIDQLKNDSQEIYSYELKDRRAPSGESYEASLELKVKRGNHNERLIGYMEEFDDVTISSIE